MTYDEIESLFYDFVQAHNDGRIEIKYVGEGGYEIWCRLVRAASEQEVCICR